MKKRYGADTRTWQQICQRYPKIANVRWAGDVQLLKKDPTLEATLLQLVEPYTGGDPMSEKRWLNRRLTDIAAALHEKQRVSRPVISRLLRQKHYRL